MPAVGAAGGPTNIRQTLLAILNVLDFGMDLPAALAAARFHHQWSPDGLKIEDGAGASVLAARRARGQRISVGGSFGTRNAVGGASEGAGFEGSNDPRPPGLPAGL